MNGINKKKIRISKHTERDGKRDINRSKENRPTEL